MALEYPIYKKDLTGNTFIKIASEITYFQIFIGKRDVTTQYSYSKTTLPMGYYRMFDGNSYTDSTEDEFKEACETYFKFSEDLKKNINGL